MLRIFTLAAAASFASADCNADLMNFFSTNTAIVGTPAQQLEFVTSSCADKTAFTAGLDALAASCAATQPEVSVILDLLKIEICAERDGVFCLSSFLALIDQSYFLQLIDSNPVFVPPLDRVFADVPRKTALCASDACYFDLRAAARTASATASVATKAVIKDILKQVSCGCSKDSQMNYCRDDMATLVTTGNFLPASACDGIDGSICARKMSGCAAWPVFDVAVTCPAPAGRPLAVSFLLTMKNVQYSYYTSNMAQFEATLKNDVLTNLKPFGVMIPDMDITFEDKTPFLGIRVQLYGELLKTLDFQTYMIFAQGYARAGIFNLDNLEALVPLSGRADTSALLSSVGNLELTEIQVIPSTGSPSAEADASSVRTVAVGALALIAPLVL